jgi:hypothetical protein
MTRREILTLGLGIGCSLLGCATVPPRLGEARKKLIEFGWDEPDTVFLRRHLAQMERTPFDGCVFRVTSSRPDSTLGPFLWEAWGRHAFGDDELQSALDDLQATPFHRFTDNFLRFNVTPGDVDWFEDFSAVVANAGLAARIACAGKAKGILFDVEQYVSPLFTYRKQSRVGTVAWEEYAAQARRRGREVMEAFQGGYPDLLVFLTFGYSQPWRETRGGLKPLAECEYGLLAPFLDGLVDAARGNTRFVDGYEPAYFHNKDTRVFAIARRVITRDVLAIVADPSAYRQRFSVSFGLWMDFESATRGWDGVDASKNFYSPEEFEQSVRVALECADEYVWIYSEIPRWWSAGGPPVNLPVAYADTLRRARQNTRSQFPRIK